MSYVEKVRRDRILLSIYAYAYEIRNTPLVDDATFDKLAMELDTTTETGNVEMDTFFREKYTPYSGIWVLDHPSFDLLERVSLLYNSSTS
jgi:hypothetical protein